MAMNYTTLLAAKGTAGSIANWVGYNKLDLPTILDEAQSLLYTMLRLRQMKTEWTFGVSVGQSEVALPSGFLDPLGGILIVGYGMEVRQRPEEQVKGYRTYDNTLSGSFDTDPLTTVLNSSLVNVELTGHGLSQGSTITTADFDAVGGLTLNGTYPVTAIIDSDNFTIDAGAQATSSATGGGDDGTYTANNLIAATPTTFGMWGEAIKFECAFDTAQACKLLYYKSPPLLSASNPTNWLTTRYPKLLRIACQAAAADFMKDTEEYNKSLSALNNLIQTIAAEDDLSMRGADIVTETP